MLQVIALQLLLSLAFSGVAAGAEPPRRPPGPPDGGPPGRVDDDDQEPRPEPGRGARRGRAEPPAFRWGRMPEAERNELRHFMEEHFPRMALELDRLREEAPGRFERRMLRIGPEMRRLMDEMKHDPQRGLVMIRERQISIQLRLLVVDYHQTDDPEKRRELREKIEDAVSQEFQAKMERRAAEVHQMETRLAELRNRLSEMHSLRDEMIERRVKEMLEKRPPGPRERDDVDLRDGPRARRARPPEVEDDE